VLRSPLTRPPQPLSSLTHSVLTRSPISRTPDLPDPPRRRATRAAPELRAPLAAGPRTPLAARLCAPLAAGHRALLAAGLRAPLAAGLCTPLPTGLRAPLAAGLCAPLAAGLRAPLAAGWTSRTTRSHGRYLTPPGPQMPPPLSLLAADTAATRCLVSPCDSAPSFPIFHFLVLPTPSSWARSGPDQHIRGGGSQQHPPSAARRQCLRALSGHSQAVQPVPALAPSSYTPSQGKSLPSRTLACAA